MKADRKLVIAIDGPAGSGKSTIAARLANKLGYVNLESGAMYRALALKALEHGISLDDAEALRQLALKTVIHLEPTPDGNLVLLDGRDVSRRIREADVTRAASRVSIHPPVREIMVDRQRDLGRGGGVVMEGRDIGTVVFPNAEVKIFLDADPDVRAERRVLQQGLGPRETQTVATELASRDQRDRTRSTSPLVAAPDAVHIDSTRKSIDEVVAEVERLIIERTNSAKQLEHRGTPLRTK
jgi:cytidylate kinase